MALSDLTNQDVLPMTSVINALKQALDKSLVSIVLFGSRARGEADDFSDWDLLVIARNLPKKPFQRHLHLKKILPDLWRGQVAILAKTPAEFEAYLPSLYLDIALDGSILFDTNGYAAESLGRLRRLIQTKGLRREQEENDFVWHWQNFPGFNWTLEWETIP
jgi:predicted nucleotidyltransferase